jgi:hypothetical protein
MEQELKLTDTLALIPNIQQQCRHNQSVLRYMHLGLREII